MTQSRRQGSNREDSMLISSLALRRKIETNPVCKYISKEDLELSSMLYPRKYPVRKG
jgi:hypothetical protein